MKTTIPGLFAALMVATGSGAPALAGSGDVVVDGAWARASIGTNRPGVAYMTIRNAGDETVTLTGMKTDLAKRPQVHRTTTDEEGMSSMSPAGEIEISPGETVTLEPGGLHAMLMMLRHPMVEGETFDLMLTFSDGGDVHVEVPVLGIAARGPGG